MNNDLFRQGRIQVRRPAIVSPSAFPTSASYVGRQSRFDERSRRRYGDWSVLGVPAMLLWLDDVAAADCLDNSCDDNY
ncbi:hypothetical protein [Acidicapsa acidisoli]|uniref:hypothetical protein n=1 Tax=Acidicapsa acidisoli TaxID=1615681 RepID=UPI0021E073D2|nr:hypothetical protein [Acidicapsa acidisoli]